MLIRSFEEFNNEFGIDNEPMSNIRIKDIGKDISLTPIGIIMRDEKPSSINEKRFNIILNIHPTEGTHWVLVIRRGGGNIYCFDSFGVETPPLFLKENNDLVLMKEYRFIMNLIVEHIFHVWSILLIEDLQ